MRYASQINPSNAQQKIPRFFQPPQREKEKGDGDRWDIALGEVGRERESRLRKKRG